jgi:predicted lactoylglutathione lyase
MKIDAIAITSSNLKEAAKFYELLGFKFNDFGEDEKHIEPVTKNDEVRLMIDSKDLIEELNGNKPSSPNHSTFAILCDSSDEVNQLVSKIKSNGYEIVKEPFDAFWGQRYATIKDPDGYMIDLFASL